MLHPDGYRELSSSAALSFERGFAESDQACASAYAKSPPHLTIFARPRIYSFTGQKCAACCLDSNCTALGIVAWYVNTNVLISAG